VLLLAHAVRSQPHHRSGSGLGVAAVILAVVPLAGDLQRRPVGRHDGHRVRCRLVALGLARLGFITELLEADTLRLRTASR
jgi:hypothetical protein